jgi:hypothetical protein
VENHKFLILRTVFMKKYLFLLVLTAFAAFMILPLSIYASCGYTLSFDNTIIDYLDTIIGNKSATTTLKITNTGCGTYNNLSISLTGESGEFIIESNTCTGSLSSAASCQVVLSFMPSTAGNHSALLTLTTNEATFTNKVSLSGTGIAVDNTALLVAAAASRDKSSGCNATASTGAAGGKSFGPAALGLVAVMGLLLGAVAIRRGTRKRG